MARYIDIESAGIRKANREQFLVPEFADGWNAVLKILEKEPTADVVDVKQIKIIRDDLKWWLETNSENGVVYIPDFVVENMIAKMTRTPKERGE